MFGGIGGVAAQGGAAAVSLSRDFTPRVEVVDASTVLLDLQGLERLWPSRQALGEALAAQAAARGLTCAVALASTRAAALLLCRGLPGCTVVDPGREREALAPLPLEVLRLPPDVHDRLRLWGLRTLGELAALPAAGLAERLGPDGPRWRRLARGEDEAPLVATPAPECFECTLELEWPIDGLQPLSFVLARVLEPLCARLLERGRKAAALSLELRLTDGSTHVRTLRPAAPSAEARTWRTLLLLDLEPHPPKDAVQALTVRAEATPSRRVQFSLLDPAQPSPERLAETLARLQSWTEKGRAGAARLLDTYRPDGFVVTTFAPGTRRTPAPARPPRARVSLRVFRPPLPARVDLKDGALAFVSAGRVRGPVAESAGPWRSSGDWWDAAWSRAEWDVTVAGAVYRLCYDHLREAWFVEGELD